jgi:hypothetical protein
MVKTLRVLGAASLAMMLGMSAATAEVVCNDDGDCWRVKERHQYSPELKLRVQPNDWRWSDNEKDRYRWREVPSGKSERGYWRQGVWVEIN